MDETTYLSAVRAHATIYATGLLDMEAKVLIDMVEGNSAADLRRWTNNADPDWLAGIEVVPTDLAESAPLQRPITPASRLHTSIDGVVHLHRPAPPVPGRSNSGIASVLEPSARTRIRNSNGFNLLRPRSDRHNGAEGDAPGLRVPLDGLTTRPESSRRLADEVLGRSVFDGRQMSGRGDSLALNHPSTSSLDERLRQVPRTDGGEIPHPSHS